MEGDLRHLHWPFFNLGSVEWYIENERPTLDPGGSHHKDLMRLTKQILEWLMI